MEVLDVEGLKSRGDQEKLDLVSYRGPRSMVTVDMSVDTRSIIGDDSVDVVPLWRSLFRPRWLSADNRI